MQINAHCLFLKRTVIKKCTSDSSDRQFSIALFLSLLIAYYKITKNIFNYVRQYLRETTLKS